MSHDKEPDAEYIQKFAEDKRTEFGQQAMLDKEIYDIYLRMERQDVYRPARSNGVNIKGIRTGFAGIAVEQNAAALSGAVAWTVAHRSTKPDDVAHADGKLEPFLNALPSASATGEVLFTQIRDLDLGGRGWSQFTCLPRLWAENDFRDLLERYIKSTEENQKRVEAGKDNEKIREEIKHLEEEIAAYKKSNFPLRWRTVDYRTTWPQRSDERYLPEVVEIRQMTKRQIVAEYGEGALPGDYAESDAMTKIEVLAYSNWVWSAVCIGSREDPKIAQIWDHNAGMSPYVFMEVNVQPHNDRGIVWLPRLFHFKDMLEAENELLTQARDIVRRESETDYQLTLDPIRNDAKIAGNPGSVEISDKDGITRLWKGEAFTLIPTPILNPEHTKLLDRVHDYNTQFVLNPVRRGELLSGTSATAFDVAKSTAKESLGPYRKAIEHGLTHMGKLAFRYIPRLNEEFPDSPDPLVVVDPDYGEISVTPKDVRGQEPYIGVRIGDTGPVSENQKMDLALKMKSLKIDDATILSKLGFENAQEIIQLWERDQIRAQFMQATAAAIQQQAGQMAQQTASPDMANLAAEIQNMDPAAILAMAQNGSPEALVALGRMRQAASNSARMGVPQEMQTPEIPGVPIA